MNHAHKNYCAAALVALGLGSAFLCGPPGDMPEVIANLEGPPQVNAAAVAPLPLRLHSKAPSRKEVLAGGTLDQAGIGLGTSGVILSAAEADSVREPPAYQSTQGSSNDGWVPLPCPVEIDTDAAPLKAIPHASNERDKWLLTPPAMPRSYESNTTSANASSSLASAHNPTSSTSTDTSAWWTQDTPRLQGLSGSPSAAAPNYSNNNLVPIPTTAIQSAAPMNSLPAPIAMSDPPIIETVPPREQAPQARPQVESFRIHKISDGDTLSRLAERYLRDPGRAREILELNRDLLTNPDLLPIGASLRIPGVSKQEEFDSGVSTSGNRMVPVTVASPTVEAQPRAQLQGPTPLAANNW